MQKTNQTTKMYNEAFSAKVQPEISMTGEKFPGAQDSAAVKREILHTFPFDKDVSSYSSDSSDSQRDFAWFDIKLYRPHPNNDGIVPNSPTKDAQKITKTHLGSPKTERPGYTESKRSSRSDFRRMRVEEKLDLDLGAQISSQRTVKINQQRR
jgi:hypothetical protein